MTSSRGAGSHGAGRFAPSPTGELHLGNLRTAVAAWLAARSSGRSFLVRMEDLDRTQSSTAHERSQLADLAAIGLDWDGVVVRQSERFPLYERAIAELTRRGLTYECFCSRRDIRREIEAAAVAPHGPPGSYPGTCRDLRPAERDERRDAGRPPALRLRAPVGDEVIEIGVDDRVAGRFFGAVDDVVLRRNDGVPAYNLAVVVDDADQGVDQVVRAVDLLASTPRQVHLQELLGLSAPEYVHVPLVVGDDGERLAKRHGAVTLRELADDGVAIADVISWFATSLGLANAGEVVSVNELVDRFDVDATPTSTVSAPDIITPSAAQNRPRKKM